MNKTLTRKLAVTNAAVSTLAGGTLTVASITNASPIQVTLGTDNPTGAGVGYHGWNDGTIVTIAGGTVPAGWVAKKYYKIKAVTGQPTKFDLYDSALNPTTAPGATTVTGTWIVTPYIAPGHYTVRVTVTGGAIRYMEGGYPTTGTTGVGIDIAGGEKFVIRCDPNDLRFIASSATAAVLSFEIIPFSAGEFINDVQTPTSTGITVTAEVEAGSEVKVYGLNGSGVATAANPFPVQVAGVTTTAVASATNAVPVQLSVSGGGASLVNPVPVTDAYHTIFQRSDIRSLADSTTALTGIKVFGLTVGSVVMSQSSKKVWIRNNSGQSISVGFCAGPAVRGGGITAISDADPMVVTISAGHGIADGDKVRIILTNGTGDVAKCNTVVNATATDATHFTIANATTDPTWGITYATGNAATAAGYWYSGYTQCSMAHDWKTGSIVEGGIVLENDTIPNSFFELPFQIGMLEIGNNSGSALAATGGCIYFFS